MKQILRIAVRDIVATLSTKGFVIGVLLTPAMLAVIMFVANRFDFDRAPKIDGEVAVAGASAELTASLEEALSQRAIAIRRGQLQAKMREAIAEQAPGAEPLANPEAMLAQILGEIPEIGIVSLPAGTDIEAEKDALRQAAAASGKRLAVARIHDNAIEADGQGVYGNYDLFLRDKLDQRIVETIQEGIREAIVGERIRSAGYDRERIERLTRVGRVHSTTVTEAGEETHNELLNTMLPAGFMVLLLVSVFTGGQYLLTTTLEEKQSRVVEVLLSAVSPMQLMAGKILAQMVIGLIIIALYAGLGISALSFFAVLNLIDPLHFVYLGIFYLISYSVVGSFMAAIGAAVNEPREAQSFMMPVMMVMMLPWMLWIFIVRDPNSFFATAASFLPPINTFVMMLRITSTSPPPFWQVAVSIAIGVASVYGALWVAAKVFRVGLLLHGKPPSFGTLVRWVRMA